MPAQYTYLACDLVSGEVRAELPMRIQGELTRLLQNVGTGTLELPTRDVPAHVDWPDLTIPWRTLLLVVDDDGRIVWSGIPDRRPRTHDPVIAFPCLTPESYFARRKAIGEFTFDDQTSVIAATLGGVITGIGGTVDCPESGVFRDREYTLDENKSVLTALQELAGVIDGPEWTIDVDWSDASQTAVSKVFRTGHPNLGAILELPENVFEVPGTITEFEYDEGWSEGDAATQVQATGDGEGVSLVTSNPITDTAALAAGWPLLEETRSFSGVTEQATIDEHAEGLALELFGGQHIVTFTARADRPPRPRDVNLGDSVRVQITSDTLPEQADGSPGLDQVWRCIGWALQADAATWKPMLALVPFWG